MSTASTAICPKCHRQVSLPNIDDHSVWVRCPLCSGQYSLRMALDHVPPSLEVLGPGAEASFAGQSEMSAAGFGDPGTAGIALGDISAHGEVAPHADVSDPADTLSHPEHGGMIAPLGAEHFMQADHATNGEQPIGLQPDTAGQSPAIGQVAGEHPDIADHLIDFDLESHEHGEAAPDGSGQSELAEHDELSTHPEHAAFGDEIPLEHDPAAAFGEMHDVETADPNAEHTIEPMGEHDGDPMFRFADDEAAGHDEATGHGEESGEEGEGHESMGGIATMVNSAPPAKKRREAPLAVKLIGLLIGLGFGLIGCYLVYGIFLYTGSDQFHLKQFFPHFLQNRVADTSGKARTNKPPEKLTSGSIAPSTPSSGALSGPVSPIDQANAPSNGSPPPVNPLTTGNNQPASPPADTGPATPGGNTVASQPTSPAQGKSTSPKSIPGKPAPGDVAQQTSGKLDTVEDPTKVPPPDFDKPEMTKPDASAIAPPNFDTPASPLGNAKATGKTADKSPEKNFENSEKAPDKTSGTTPDVVPDKSPDKSASPAVPDTAGPAAGIASKSPEQPPAKHRETGDNSATVPPEKTIDKPVTQSPGKSGDNLFPPEPKTAISDQLANVDVAMNMSTTAADNLKAADVPGADPKSVLRAGALSYKAMSHLATELGAIENPPGDPETTTRIEQLRKKAAALAAAMGTPAERGATADLAKRWIASPSRKEQGAVIVGTLAKVDPADGGFVAHITLPNDSKEMTFTTVKKPDAAEGSTVVVLGLLTTDTGGKAVEIVPPVDASSATPPPAKSLPETAPVPTPVPSKPQ